MLDPEASEPEGLRKIGEVRIAEVRADRSLEFRELFPTDAPETAVPEDEVHRRRVLPLRRLQFMDAHQEPAISAQGHDPTIRIQELGSDSAREGDSHRGQDVREDDRLA